MLFLGAAPDINRFTREAIIRADLNEGNPIAFDQPIERAAMNAQKLADFREGQHWLQCASVFQMDCHTFNLIT
jgi:hypothetical protein